MSFRDILRTALGNLGRHLARTALTTVGVIVGILTIVTMVSLGIGVQREMSSAFGSVGLETVRLYPTTDDAGSFNLFGTEERTMLLTPELVRELQARDDVLEAVPFLQLPRGMPLTLRLRGREVQAAPWGPRPASVPDPFEMPPSTLAGDELPGA